MARESERRPILISLLLEEMGYGKTEVEDSVTAKGDVCEPTGGTDVAKEGFDTIRDSFDNS